LVATSGDCENAGNQFRAAIDELRNSEDMSALDHFIILAVARSSVISFWGGTKDAAFCMGVSRPTAPRSGKGKDKHKPWFLSPRGMVAKKQASPQTGVQKQEQHWRTEGRPAFGSHTIKGIGAVCPYQQ
jgi:hypothetical protein